MSALLDSLAAGFHGSEEQRGLLDAALAAGLPGPRSEAWKYTSLRALERRRFVPSTPTLANIEPGLPADIPAPRLVFVNGRFDPQHSDPTGLPADVELAAISQLPDDAACTDRFARRHFKRSDEIFSGFNTALADDGVALRIGADVHVERPMHLVFIGVPAQADIAWHLRHVIELAAGAFATVVEHHIHDGEHAHFGNVLAQVRLAPGSNLMHARIQDESARATLMTRTDAVLARDAHYQRTDLELGCGLSRHELNVRLEGERARMSANGVLLASGRRHLDTRLGIEHIARDTTCKLLWRGLATGRGRAVFHGGIVIQPGADGADARLSNKNLLLSDNAEIDTQPVLEIHADEVKAAHGATVGQLDPMAMFYLRSRGLPEPDARRLLTTAFCREVIAHLHVPVLHEQLTQALDRALVALENA